MQRISFSALLLAVASLLEEVVRFAVGLENEKLVNELHQSVELVNEFFELAVGEELLLLQVG